MSIQTTDESNVMRVLELEKERKCDCGCLSSDAWRCAVKQNLPTVACRCSCHKAKSA